MNTTNTQLSAHRVGTHETYYVPNFVSVEEEEYLVRKITESPQKKWRYLANRRLQLWGGEVSDKNVLLAEAFPPFLQSYPNIIDRIASTGAFEGSPHGVPNHVILNEYLPGQGIMPHQDGPTYHPVVATLSLGSHAAFHYYQYKQPDGDSSDTPADPGEGRVIDPNPVLSILLEPRSLIISTGAMYASHLHGIREVNVDEIYPASGPKPPTFGREGWEVANWDMLNGEQGKAAIVDGGKLERSTRYSLTCRDVARVSNAKKIFGR